MAVLRIFEHFSAVPRTDSKFTEPLWLLRTSAEYSKKSSEVPQKLGKSYFCKARSIVGLKKLEIQRISKISRTLLQGDHRTGKAGNLKVIRKIVKYPFSSFFQRKRLIKFPTTAEIGKAAKSSRNFRESFEFFKNLWEDLSLLGLWPFWDFYSTLWQFWEPLEKFRELVDSSGNWWEIHKISVNFKSFWEDSKHGGKFRKLLGISKTFYNS